MSNLEESLRSLSLDFLNLLINGQAFSDVTFSVEGRLVHAHRCILAARSLFFRKFFCGTDSPQPVTGIDPTQHGSVPASPTRGSTAPAGIIPVNSVGYEVFLLLLQFLYSGQVSIVPQKHEPRPNCGERGCWHTHCSAAVDLALDTLAASRYFGVEQLALLTQKQLASMVEKASIEDVMKVLIASRKQDMHQLWTTCSHLVAKSGLPPEILAKHLPIDVVTKIEELRLKSSIARRSLMPHNHHHDLSVAQDLEDQKIRRMRRALDSSDVELVKLMVMGEGLNLDESLALHYAVESCSREVVKALLELGAADVNYPAGPAGKTPLHIAAEMVSPDMVAVLLDHHADPNVRTVGGITPLDILRTLTSDFLFKGAVPGLTHIEPNKLRLCLELVQSAAMVISREEGNNSNNQNNDNNTGIYPHMNEEHNSGSSGGSNNNLDSRLVYLNLGAGTPKARAMSSSVDFVTEQGRCGDDGNGAGETVKNGEIDHLLSEPSAPTISLPTESFLRAATLLKNQVVEATWKGGVEALASGSGPVLDPTVYTGLLGTAFTCLKSYEVTRNHQDLLTCAEIIDTCANVARATTRHVTFLCGRGGVCTLGAIVANYRGDQSKRDFFLGLFLELAEERELPAGPEEGGFGMSYDLLYGRAGFLWAALFLNRYLGQGTVPDHLLSPIVAAILAGGRVGAADHEACPLLYRFHGTRFWGAANGLAGILYVLLHFPLSEEDVKDVQGTLRYMMSNRFPNSGNYPCSEGNPRDKLVQWAHGATGMAITLAKASQVFPKERDFREAAIEAGEVVWKSGLVKKVGLADGVAGNAYAFLSLYRLTGDVVYEERAKAFASYLCRDAIELVNMTSQETEHDYSLFRGLAGPVCLWFDLVSPVDSKFPGYEI